MTCNMIPAFIQDESGAAIIFTSLDIKNDPRMTPFHLQTEPYFSKDRSMSVLHLPRLIFSGKFQADPSTVNNNPDNYQLSKNPESLDASWNPMGTGHWNLIDCVVTRVVYKDGTFCDDPAIDPIVGTSILSNADSSPARIVDLDPDNQLTSSIWGMTVHAGKRDEFGFSGPFAVASFQDMFPRTSGDGASGDVASGAVWQSVLTPVSLFGAGKSRYLAELTKDSDPSILSIKFNIDGYNMRSDSPGFTFGRLVGSIAPYISGEPKRFIAGRTLDPTGQSLVAPAYCEIINNSITIDLANSLPTVQPGGVLADIEALDLVVLKNDGIQVIGHISYLESGFYEKTAGIVSFTLKQDLLKDVQENPLAIISHSTNKVQLQEAKDGIWVRSDETVFRLNPGDSVTTILHASKFGKPAAGLTIHIGFAILIGFETYNEPRSALQFPESITTDENGLANLSIMARDPGNPRKFIDGQVYAISYSAKKMRSANVHYINSSRILNLLVWSGYTIPEIPTWENNVQPILTQYANLYPVMKDYVDLSRFDSVAQSASHIKRAMQLSQNNPNYMPTTRDLSANKRAMILKWCDKPI